MATIFQNPQDNKDENGVQPVNFGQPSSAPSGPQPTGQQQSPKGTTSGRFTNIQKYLEANKGYNAPQGGLAGQISNRIGGQQQDVQKNIQGAQQQFQNLSNQGAQGYQNTGLINQALSNPTQFVQDQNNLQQFGNLREAQYKGPQGLQGLAGKQNLTNLQTQAQNVQNLAGQAQTEQGRYGLLSQFFNKPTYSQGQQNLDQLLLQGNRGQLNQLAALRKQAVQSQQSLNQAQQQAQQQAGQQAGQAQQVRSQVANALGSETGGTGALGTFAQNLGQEQQQALANLNKEYGGVQQQLQTGQLSPELMSRLGVRSGQHLYGLNLNDLLSSDALAKSQQSVNAASVASPEEYAKYQALSQLAGIAPTTLTGTKQQNVQNIAGQLQDISGQLNERQKTVEGSQQYQTAQNTINQMTGMQNAIANDPLGFSNRIFDSNTTTNLGTGKSPQQYLQEAGGIEAVARQNISKDINSIKQSQQAALNNLMGGTVGFSSGLGSVLTPTTTIPNQPVEYGVT